MKYAPKLNSAVDKEGVWGPVTATLDWCEDNYASTVYVAELWNTVSNLAMILPALLGLYHLYKIGAERRFIMCFVTLAIVGFGSWLFHSTLSRSMQLVDELSMLFTVSVLLYVVRESRSPFNQPNTILAASLFGGCILVSALYIFIHHPLFHQVAYILTVGIVVVEGLSVVYKNPVYMRLYVCSMLFFVFGCLCWEIDIHGCSHLREMRKSMHEGSTLYMLYGLTQFHAWWHVLAGLGTYGHIITMCSTRSLILGRPHGVTYVAGILPVLTTDFSAEKKM